MKIFTLWSLLLPAFAFCGEEPTAVKLPYGAGTELNVPGTTESKTRMRTRDDEEYGDDFLSKPLVQYAGADGTSSDGDDTYWDEYTRQYDPEAVDDEALDESDEKKSNE